MSFTEAFKDLLTGVAVATAKGNGQFAYKIAQTAVDMVAAGLLEAINGADVCDDCRLKLSVETAKLVDQLHLMQEPEAPSGFSTHHRAGDFIQCEACKGFGIIRGVSTCSRTRRAKCVACDGKGRILKKAEASTDVDFLQLVCSRCKKAPDHKDAMTLLGQAGGSGDLVCFRCGSK